MNLSAYLFGKDRTTSLQFSLLSIFIFIMLIALNMKSGPAFTGFLYTLFLVAMLGLAILSAYLNNGLLISCWIACLPTIGLWTFHFNWMIGFDITHINIIFTNAIGNGLLFGLPIGIIGYFVGYGADYFTNMN